MNKTSLTIAVALLSASFISHATAAAPASASCAIPPAVVTQVQTLNAHWQAAEGDAQLLRYQVKNLQDLMVKMQGGANKVNADRNDKAAKLKSSQSLLSAKLSIILHQSSVIDALTRQIAGLTAKMENLNKKLATKPATRHPGE